MGYQILKDRSFILVNGSDAEKFLQGLITKNTSNMQQLTYALMLDSKGKYLYELFIYKLSEGYLIEILSRHKESFINKIKMYKLRSQVDICDMHDDYVCVLSLSEIKNARLSALDPRYDQLGFRSLIGKNDLSKLEINKAALEDIYSDFKYKFAVPNNMDMVQEKSFPLEFGLDYLNAIDFDKGCYIGQEPISRAKYRGVVRKNIYKLEAISDISDIPAGTEIMAGDIKIGQLCSSYGTIGIGLIREEELNEAKALDASIMLGNIMVKISIPEWRKV